MHHSMNVILIISWCCQFYNSHAQMFTMLLQNEYTHFIASSTHSFFLFSLISLNAVCVCFFFNLNLMKMGCRREKEKKTASNPWSQCAHNVINLNSMPENQKLIKYIYAHCVWLRACIMWIQFTQYILFKCKNTWIAFGGANLFPFEITLYCVLYRTNCKWYIFV